MSSPADYTSQFPILENGIYLNHAAIAPWPARTAQAVRAFAAENARLGAVNYRDWIQRETRLRDQLSRMLGAASSDDIAFMKNTTEGISAVAWGLPWKEGDRIVLPLGEFPSNRLPWLAQKAQGVEVVEVDIRAAADPEQALLEALTPTADPGSGGIRLLSASAIQWSDGFRLDLARLGAGCRQRNAWFFVDAIQQMGALPLNIEACGIHALAADAHKWLLGPEGIAVFHCCEVLREQLALTQQGWHMYDRPFHFGRKDWTPSATARRFEAGSPNSMGQVALEASLQVMEETGWSEIERRVLANTDYLLQALDARPDVTVISRKENMRRGGSVSFRPEAKSAQVLHSELNQRGVACALRDGCIRVSPHYYQGESELGQFMELLDQLS